MSMISHTSTLCSRKMEGPPHGPPEDPFFDEGPLAEALVAARWREEEAWAAAVLAENNRDVERWERHAEELERELGEWSNELARRHERKQRKKRARKRWCLLVAQLLQRTPGCGPGNPQD